MPATPTIGKTDQALTNTTAGDILKSTGPAGVPTVAVASTDYSVPAADEQIDGVKTFTAGAIAAKLEIVGAAAATGPDRFAVQTADGGDLVKVDLNGTTHRYLGTAANPSGIYACDHAIQTDAMRPNIPFTANCSSHPNISGTSYNNVYGVGHNDNSAAPVVSGHYIFRDTWEDNYEVEPGVFQCERHVGSVIDPTTGQEIRPYTAAVITSSKPYTSQVTHTTSHYKQILEDGSLLVESRLSGDDYNFITPSFSSYQNLVLLLNQTAFGGNGLDSSFKLNGRTGRFDFQIGGANKWSWVAHSDNNLYINNAADQNCLYFDQAMQARFGGTVFAAPSGTLATALRLANATATGGLGDYSWKVGGPGSGVDGDLLLVHGPTNKTLIRANGTGLGFFDVTPVAQPTGELVAGLTGTGFFGAITSISLAGPITANVRYGPMTANADATTITLDVAASDFHVVTLGGDRTLALTGAPPRAFKVKLIQDGTGGWNPTWWSGITWWTADGNKPTPAAGPGKGTYVQFLTTGSGTYDGILVVAQP